jgi:hypothetical protein
MHFRLALLKLIPPNHQGKVPTSHVHYIYSSRVPKVRIDKVDRMRKTPVGPLNQNSSNVATNLHAFRVRHGAPTKNIAVEIAHKLANVRQLLSRAAIIWFALVWTSVPARAIRTFAITVITTWW